MRFLLFLAAFLACAGPAAADRFALRYEGWALGVLHIGDISVDVDVSADTYEISAVLRSRGLLNWFERTSLTAQAGGLIEDGAVRWLRYDLDHHYSRKHRRIALRVGEDGAIAAEIQPIFSSWGEPETSEEQRRASRDPLSSVVAMAIDVGRSGRCEGAYPTFDGRFHYVLELSDGDIDEFKGGGYEGEVQKCVLSYRAVAGFEPRDAGRRRVPRGQVWFALVPDSRFAPPVRINLPLSAGGASVRLSSFQRALVDIPETSAQ
jgi:hypothetical protein